MKDSLKRGYVAVTRTTNSLKGWQVALILLALGLLTYGASLSNPFIGDDIPQITENPMVQSLGHIGALFGGGTFYTGDASAPLQGYYRPLMSLTFAILYTVFGPNAFYFHLAQLLLVVVAAYVLYLILRYTFSPLVALMLSSVFLVHPVNAVMVYSAANIQDILYVLFGLLAIYTLIRYQSMKALWLSVGLLILSLFSKETGIVFLPIAALYLFWWDRDRLGRFFLLLTPPAIIYLIMRIHAVGVISPNWYNGPITDVGLWERILTMPSIFVLYMTKYVFPTSIAADYNWAEKQISFGGVVLPLLISLAIVGSLIYAGYYIRKHAEESLFYTYIFFAGWFVVSLGTTMQIIGLDVTASMRLFYAAFIGLTAALGIFAMVFVREKNISRAYLGIAGMAVVIALGVMSIQKSFDYRSMEKLSEVNISYNTDDYTAYNQLAQLALDEKDYETAATYAKKSVDIYENHRNTNNLGIALFNLGDYEGAYNAWSAGLKYDQSFAPFYNDLCILTEYYGDAKTNEEFLLSTIEKFPSESIPLIELSFLYYKNPDLSPAAKSQSLSLITKALELSPNDAYAQAVYSQITGQ